LEVLLSRTSLDLGLSVSHHTSNHPIETQKLSPLLSPMRVDLTKTGDARSRARWSAAMNPFSGSECGLGGMDCSPRRMIAVSVAVNVVLTMAIEAQNVVPKTR
jgi:hypothetical protein